MTFTWDPTDLSSDLAKIRAAIGDVDDADPILTDEIIQSLLTEYSDWHVAALHAVDRMMAVLMRNPTSRSALGLSSSHSVVQYCRELKEELSKSAYASLTPTLTGMSQSDKEVRTSDTDLLQPVFTRGGFDNGD